MRQGLPAPIYIRILKSSQSRQSRHPYYKSGTERSLPIPCFLRYVVLQWNITQHRYTGYGQYMKSKEGWSHDDEKLWLSRSTILVTPIEQSTVQRGGQKCVKENKTLSGSTKVINMPAKSTGKALWTRSTGSCMSKADHCIRHCIPLVSN